MQIQTKNKTETSNMPGPHGFICTPSRRILFRPLSTIFKILPGLKRFLRKMREADVKTSTAPSGWGCRHTLAVLCFLGSAVSYAMRFNLSLAIVAMINRTKTASPASGSSSIAHNNVTPSCSHLIDDDLDSMMMKKDDNPLDIGGEFNWSEAEQGIILGSFFWGYIVTQIPGGMLSKRFGGKYPFGLGLLVTAIFTLITPWAARTHKGLLIFVRIVEGLGSGLHIASQTALLAAWAPPNERSFLGTIGYGGTFFGTAATLVAGGYLIQGNILGGWSGVFYVTGIVSIIWFILWTFLVYNSPSEHPRISNEEKVYIETSMGSTHQTSVARSEMPVPWKDILTSLPLWATFISHVAHCWGIYTLLTEMPTYMRTVLHFNIKKNSWLSAIPYITAWVIGIVYANLADVAIRKNVVRTITVRKTAQIIAHAASALALIGCAYSGCSRVLTVSFLILAVGLTGTANSGFIINYVDLSPNHASVIIGWTNTLANICGVGAPYVAGLLINNDPSVENWKIVFLISAGVFLFGALFYTLYASGTEQPWNHFKKLNYEEEDDDDDYNKRAVTTPSPSFPSPKSFDVRIHDHDLIARHKDFTEGTQEEDTNRLYN